MSIRSEITRINNNIAAAYTAAENKGATMPATENSANLAQTVASIPEAVQPTLITKQITENGTYAAADDNADGYSQVNVGVYEVESYLANTLTSVTLPTLTSIPDNAFKNKSALVSVSAPNVTSLGVYAFQSCSNLKTISFSNQMTSVGANCFYDCNKLLLSELPDTITTIGARAFQQCKKIDITKLPSSITSIGNYAFYDCRAIPFLDMTHMPMVPPTLGSNVFETRRELIFYFDTQAKLDAYSAATNWSAYASSFQIKP